MTSVWSKDNQAHKVVLPPPPGCQPRRARGSAAAFPLVASAIVLLLENSHWKVHQ
jgi:hypothetical protein